MAVGALRAWNDGREYTDGVVTVYPILVAGNTIEAQIDVRRKGKLKLFRIRLSAAAGGAAIYTVFKNNVATAISVTFGAAETEKSDNLDSISVARGDEIEVRSLGANPPLGTVVRGALGFLPACASCREQGYSDTLEWGVQDRTVA